MAHQRNRSEGLNIGEGFPTTYSSFAVTADSRTDGRLSSASYGAAKHGASSLKRRTSSPPRSTASGSHLRGYQPQDTSSSSRFAYKESGISTTKSLNVLVREFKKRWTFVLFFLAFSAMLVFGIMLPVSRSKTLRSTQPGAARREVTYRSTRSKVPASTPEEAVAAALGPNRFARWAAALFGTASSGRQVIFPASMGNLELPDYTIPTATPDPTQISIAEKQAGRRSQKRMAEGAVGQEEHEHPSRVVRRERLQASSLAEEDKQREAEMAKQRQLRRRVMERVARAFKAGRIERPEAVQVVDSPDGEHILDIYEAAHPEVVEAESDFI